VVLILRIVAQGPDDEPELPTPGNVAATGATGA
jgi:hypothetical protein